MKIFYTSVFAATLALSATSASAAVVTCPNPVLPDPRDYFVQLTTANNLTATCYDYGALGINGNPEPNVVNNVPRVFDNGTVELPATISTTPLQIDGGAGGAFSGFNSGGTSGSVTFLKNAASPLYLLFKFGGGQNAPYFFVFQFTGVNSGESVNWLISQTTGTTPINGLSGIRLFGNTTTSNNCQNPGGCDPGDVPEPATMALLGLGLLGAGLVRRRKQ